MDQIPTTTGKPQAVAVTPGSATGNVATKTLLRAFIIHLPKCRCLFLSMAPKPYLDGTQLGGGPGRVGSVDY
jgi:hypothetical protein